NEAAAPASQPLSAGHHRRSLEMWVQRPFVLRGPLLLCPAPKRKSPRRFAALCDRARQVVRGRRWHRPHPPFTPGRCRRREEICRALWRAGVDSSRGPARGSVCDRRHGGRVHPRDRAKPACDSGARPYPRQRLLDDNLLFTGDSLAWSMRDQDLVAFRDACWYSWSALTTSLAKLADYSVRVGTARPWLAGTLQCTGDERAAAGTC